MTHTPGPYTITEFEEFRSVEVRGADERHICMAGTKDDAERIAYCLRIVEESEETDRVRG